MKAKSSQDGLLGNSIPLCLTFLQIDFNTPQLLSLIFLMLKTVQQLLSKQLCSPQYIIQTQIQLKPDQLNIERRGLSLDTKIELVIFCCNLFQLLSFLFVLEKNFLFKTFFYVFYCFVRQKGKSIECILCGKRKNTSNGARNILCF